MWPLLWEKGSMVFKESLLLASLLHLMYKSIIRQGTTCSTGDVGLIPGSRRSPGEGNGTSFQYSCLQNPMDRGAWWATVHGVTRA